MNEQKIITPCPSCGGKTLFVGTGGHLTCSLIVCKEPVVETAIAQLKNELEQLKKDCEPFRAQIDQRKTYKVNLPLI